MKLWSTIVTGAALATSGCAPTYTLIAVAPVGVARNTIHVTPGVAWNKAPPSPQNVAWEEKWTENGALLDQITFIGGLPDGQAIARQRRKDDRQVPVFHATMTAPDLVSMVESYYRLKAGATIFTTTRVAPTTFTGRPGLALDYAFVGEDQVKRLGRTVVAIDKGKLYMMSLEGAALHYFAAALPDFNAMTASASARSGAPTRGD